MPAGVDWPTYLKFTTAALFTMLAGSQTVHLYYKPLNDIEKYVEAERKHLEHVRDVQQGHQKIS